MPDLNLDATYERYYPVIWAKCTRMLRDPHDAHDLAQEAFSRLWAHGDALRDPDAALAWIYRTATRLAVDHLRKKRETPWEPGVMAEAPPAGEDPCDPIVDLEARDLLQRLARQLSPAESEALVLSRLDGLTHAETAAVLGCSERSVRRLLTRAEARLWRLRGGAT